MSGQSHIAGDFLRLEIPQHCLSFFFRIPPVKGVAGLIRGLGLCKEFTVAYLPGCHFTSAVRIVHNVESTAYREENNHSHDHHDQDTNQAVQNADGNILASVNAAAEPFSFRTDCFLRLLRRFRLRGDFCCLFFCILCCHSFLIHNFSFS